MDEKIVVLDGATLNPGDNPWTELETLGELQVYERTEPADVLTRANQATILVVNKVRMDATLFAELPRLRLVAVTATGHDCVDGQAARAKGVTVVNVPVYGTDSVAQHVFALILHQLHRVDLHDEAIRRGEWAARRDFSFWLTPLTELAGKTLGIFGFGRIGRRVAELGSAFGMKILAHTRSAQASPPWDRFEWVDQDRLARESDILSLHCPLNDQTRAIIDRDWLQKMKPTAVLINASRGALVHEPDLAAALNEGVIAGAALDVVSQEPIRDDNRLLTAKNCLLTPHLAWAALEARQRLMQITVDNIRSFLDGRPTNVVNAG